MPDAGEEIVSEIPTDKVLAMRQQGMSNNQIIQTLQREGYSTSNIFSAMSQANMKSGVDQGSSMPQEQVQAPMEFAAPEPQPMSSNQEPAVEEAPFYAQDQGVPGAAPELPAEPMQMGQQYEEDYGQMQGGYLQQQQEAPFARSQQAMPAMEPMGPQMGSPQALPTGAPVFGPAPETQRIEELAEAIIDEKWNEIVRSINKIIDWKDRSESRLSKIEQSILDMRKEFDALHKGVLGKITEYDKSLVNVGTEIKAMEKVFQKVLPTLTENVNELSKLKDDLIRK